MVLEEVLNPFISNADLFNDNNNHSTHYWEWAWINEWINSVWSAVNWLVTDRPFHVYIQDVVIYILSFVSVIAVLYLIYAWFVLFTAAWDDEKVTNTKKIILYVLGGLLIIWLAWSIYAFIAYML